MGASRFLRSLLTAAKQSVIPSFQRSSPAGVRSSFLPRLWPFTSSDANNNSPQGLSSDTGDAPDGLKTGTIHYERPARKARKESIRVFSQEEADAMDGCDFEHWSVVIVPNAFRNRKPTRDEEIDYYIKTLAKVVGSEEEARKKIYSVITQQKWKSFGVNVSEEVAIKIDELDNVYYVLPDFYMDYFKKYPGEPFINGQAVPYSRKYHDEYLYSLLPEHMREKIDPPNYDCYPPKLMCNVSRPRKVLPNNFSRPNMGQPQSDCGEGVPMNNVDPNQSGPGLELNNDGPNICGG